MVNVAGRSKACHNCKRRRVGCDEKRPKCDRCRKARLDCEGYSQPLVFVHEDPKSRQEQRLIKDAIQSAHRSDGKAVPRYLHPAALPTTEDYAHLSYLVKSLHVDDERAPSVRWRKDVLVVEADPTSTAALSLRALAATCFGRMHSHRPSSARGVALYGQALRKLSRELPQPGGKPELTHVLAALNLSMHEMAIPTTGTTWMKHARGAQQMITPLQFDPHFFQAEPARSVFLRARSMLVVQAIIDRRRTFFERSEWRTVPWSMDPGSKTPLDRLVDIMCFVPGLYEELETITVPGLGNDQAESYGKASESMKGRVTLLLAQIYRFRWAWEVSHPSCCYEVPESPGSPFAPNVISFTSLRRANEITLYNSILSMLLELALKISAPIPDPATLFPITGPIPASTNPLRLPGDDDSEDTAAIEICRCAKFHLADPTNLAGPYFLLFPLAIARRQFASRRPEKLWIEQLLKQIHDRGVFDAEVVVR